MSAIERMIRTVLNAMDFDVEEVKKEVTGRIAMFEQNLHTLNATLISHNTKLHQLDADMDALFKHFGIAREKIQTPTATQEKENERLIGSRNAAE